MTTNETVTIGRTTYTIEREFEEGSMVDQLGWLHGKRGSLAMITRSRTTGSIVLMANPNSILDRLSIGDTTALLSPYFSQA